MENGTVHPMQADQVSANRVALFMFMIGNTDWSIPNRHNIELVQPSPGTPPLVIPYDFDWSGVVDAPYAEPNPMLGLNSVKDRLFRGFCRPEESWAPVYEAFLAQKEAILALYSESTYLENAEKQRAIHYLEDFYSIIEDPRKRKMQITDMCRTDK